jgi:hypothetical protein
MKSAVMKSPGLKCRNFFAMFTTSTAKKNPPWLIQGGHYWKRELRCLYTLTGAGCLTGTGVSHPKRSSATPFTIP